MFIFFLAGERTSRSWKPFLALAVSSSAAYRQVHVKLSPSTLHSNTSTYICIYNTTSVGPVGMGGKKEHEAQQREKKQETKPAGSGRGEGARGGGLRFGEGHHKVRWSSGRSPFLLHFILLLYAAVVHTRQTNGLHFREHKQTLTLPPLQSTEQQQYASTACIYQV